MEQETEAAARFAELMVLEEHAIPLDEAALLIAAHAYPELDVGAQLARVDELADRCFAPTLDALVTYLFVDLGFSGNVRDYYDARNSFLNDVLDRRTGIPISLAVLMMAVARRLGVPLVGVSMPGHFLLRDQVDPSVFVDPFARGALLDRTGCEAAFHAVHGEEATFDPAFLQPVGTHAILGRMLANLRATFAASGDRCSLAWVLRMRTRIPGIPTEERAELASVLAADGRFVDAAREFDDLAGMLGGDLGTEYRRSAERLRARLN